jgi:S1-C subfamily serine protease
MRASRLPLGTLASLTAVALIRPAYLAGAEKQAGAPRRWSNEVIQKVRPAIVIINVTGERPATGPARTWSGLGVIIDPKGVVVMPARLAAGASKLEAVLSNGRKLTPRAVYWNSRTGLAVLKLETARPLPHIEFGDCSKVESGDAVLSLDFMLGELSFDVGLYTGRGRAGKKVGGLLHMDSVRSYPCTRDLLLNRDGKLIGVWNGTGALPACFVKESVRRLFKKDG